MLANSPNHFLSSLSPTDSRPAPISPETNERCRRAHSSTRPRTPSGRCTFPQTGVISLIVGLTSGQFVEAGMLGRNGVIGAGAPLDGAIALNSAIARGGKFGLGD